MLLLTLGLEGHWLFSIQKESEHWWYWFLIPVVHLSGQRCCPLLLLCVDRVSQIDSNFIFKYGLEMKGRVHYLRRRWVWWSEGEVSTGSQLIWYLEGALSGLPGYQILSAFCEKWLNYEHLNVCICSKLLCAAYSYPRTRTHPVLFIFCVVLF